MSQRTIRPMPHTLSRRGFLQATSAGAFASLGAPTDILAASPAPSQATAASADGLSGWFDRPMRWVQLTLVENDPGRFDPQFWLDYFRRLHADAATLSAGGIVAYYPTEVPLHHRSAWLGEPIRSGRWSPAAARSACTSSRAPIRTRCATRCGRRIRTGLPSTATGAAAAALGESRSVGHLRARSLQLRVHGPGPPRDRREVQGGRRSSRTDGRRRAATATACTASRTSRPRPDRSCPARPIRAIRRVASSSSGARRG